MPPFADLLPILEPLAAILACVAVVIAGTAAAIAAAVLCGRAVRTRQAVLFLIACLAELVAVTAAPLGLSSMAYGRPAALSDTAAAEPLSFAGLMDLVRSQQSPITVAIGAGVLVAVLLLAWSRPRRDVGAEAVLASMAGDRAAGIGDAGELLVAYELASLGWPALHNAILVERGRTIEIGHLVRAPDGIVVGDEDLCRFHRRQAWLAELDAACAIRPVHGVVPQSGAPESGACARHRALRGRSRGIGARLLGVCRARTVLRCDRAPGRAGRPAARRADRVGRSARGPKAARRRVGPFGT